ncbi:MAG: nucleotidyltransferase domain-containing protein [bacterium]
MRTELKTDPNLARMVERLKDFGGISRVILFGSRARGEHEELSDYDLLIIVPDEEYRRRMAVEIRRQLSDISVAKDIVVARQSIYDLQSGIAGTIYYEAAQDGITIYGE